MAKTDLGDKQVCPSCGAKFYDLRRRPAVCPKCTTSFDPAEDSVKTRRRGRVAAHDPAYEDDEDEAATKAKAKTGDDDDDEEEEVEEAVEIDVEADAEVLVTDEDEETEPSGDALPEGFSEEEADLGDDAADDSVPMLEDDEEFTEDEIGDIPAGEEDDDGRR